mmetsp:Transcript_38342/g.81267  ORF Transcript_38342/g.81267 Transcript_38342/m.81267 type:complete len:221 (+) Transcript_38342:622-1284(+)
MLRKSTEASGASSVRTQGDAFDLALAAACPLAALRMSEGPEWSGGWPDTSAPVGASVCVEVGVGGFAPAGVAELPDAALAGTSGATAGPHPRRPLPFLIARGSRKSDSRSGREGISSNGVPGVSPASPAGAAVAPGPRLFESTAAAGAAPAALEVVEVAAAAEIGPTIGLFATKSESVRPRRRGIPTSTHSSPLGLRELVAGVTPKGGDELPSPGDFVCF